MKKYICGAAALLLAATMLFGCGRGNVSDHPNGRITDPTVEMPTIIPEPTMTTDSTHSTTETTHPATSHTTETTHPATNPATDSTMMPEMTDILPEGSVGTEESNNHSQSYRSGKGF